VVGRHATLDFTLERGAVELEPTVVSAGPAFEVQRTDVSTPVLQEEIEKLPFNSRNVLNIAAMLTHTGPRAFDDVGRSHGASNGMRSTAASTGMSSSATSASGGSCTDMGPAKNSACQSCVDRIPTSA
jgi:hypothetical protein